MGLGKYVAGILTLLLAGITLGDQPTKKETLQFDGTEYVLSASESRDGSSMREYLHLNQAATEWTSSLSLCHFPAFTSVGFYAEKYKEIDRPLQLVEPQIESLATEESADPQETFIEQFFSGPEQAFIEYRLIFVHHSDAFEGVKVYGFSEKLQLDLETAQKKALSKKRTRQKALKELAKNPPQSPSTPAEENSNVVVKPLTGEYAKIDTRRELKAIETFLNGTDEQKERLAEKIAEAADRYAPAVFFHLARYHHEQGDNDEALFWMYAGRVRTYFDIQRCTDKTVADAVEMLGEQLPQRLRLYQFEDIDNAKAILADVIEWDATTEHNYDARWIALHGLGSQLPPAEGRHRNR